MLLYRPSTASRVGLAEKGMVGMVRVTLRFGVAVLSSVILMGCSSLSGVDRIERHADDGSHPLSVRPGSGGNGIYLPDETGPDGSWAGMFGEHIPCLNDDGVPVEITGVTWDSDPETRPISVDVYVRTFDSRKDDWLGSALGTPHDLVNPSDEDLFDTAEIREGIEGLEVTKPCGSEDEAWVKGVEEEVVFVLQSGPSGANIKNISFAYSTPDGRQYEVVDDWEFYLCGSKIPKEKRCDQ
ncbi:hypothetical protein [Myceligenerans salitolerans]|uniref:Lipoprotein n=1 Tax=Myceligenerans salitolerans TaxID=1230528 RepID=A0ABS3I690_9MICO|nr:hypothetical protein [Myceligenerans salitolerans]MBO0608517.1 hypothetical protein [Myceligenerans salitolerans]